MFPFIKICSRFCGEDIDQSEMKNLNNAKISLGKAGKLEDSETSIEEFENGGFHSYK